MNRRQSGKIALCGILAAAALVIMLLGGMIPMSTYVCPMLACILCHMVLESCGRKLAWTWYAAVSLLSLTMGPDMEATLVFVFLGYYPIIKPLIDKYRLRLLFKILLFNISILAVYVLLAAVIGVTSDPMESNAAAFAMLLILVLLANTVFFLLDMLLSRISGRISWIRREK